MRTDRAVVALERALVRSEAAGAAERANHGAINIRVAARLAAHKEVEKLSDWPWQRIEEGG